LYESRALGVILQRLPKFPDRAPDTVVGIQEDTLAPDPGNDLIPGNNLVPVFKQQEKDVERDTLKLQPMTATSESARTQVNLVALAEPDRMLHSSWLGSQGTPHDAE
jgi:hypothetical protein